MLQGLFRGLCLLAMGSVIAGCHSLPVTPGNATAAPAMPVPATSRTPATPPTQTPVPQRPLLMAHTMPWYQTPDVSGVWGWHWTMNHFDPTQVDASGRPEIASHYTPLTGPYDSSDPAILEYQTLLMKVSGIDGVIVDWYGMKDVYDYGAINESTQRLFEAIKKAGLRFAICYEDQTIGHMIDGGYLRAEDALAHGQEVMRYLQDTWFGDETYLKAGGQPVLLTFGPQYFTKGSDWEALFSVLDVQPAFVTLDGHTEAAATSSFPWPPMWAGTNGVLTEERLDQYLSSFYLKAERRDYVVGGAFPGFEDIYKEAGVGDSYGYLDPRDGETFRATLEMALGQHPDVIQLITWNDYGEGTIIEPTVEFGYRYLEMVQETRRMTDDQVFPYDALDLSLPLQLLDARRQYAGDVEVNARLDQAVDALLSGNVAGATAILAEYDAAP